MDNQNDFATNMDMKVNLGLMAVSFTVVISLLQVEKLDTDLLIALGCFSLILPINICFGFLYQMIAESLPNDYRGFFFSEKTLNILTYVALGIAFFGFLKLLDHYSIVGTFAFIVGFMIVFIIIFFSKRKADQEMKRLRRELEELKQQMNSDSIDAVDKQKVQDNQTPKTKKSKKRNKDEEVKK